MVLASGGDVGGRGGAVLAGYGVRTRRGAPLDLVTLDVVGPTVAEVHGNQTLMTTRDISSEFRCVSPMLGTEAEMC